MTVTVKCVGVVTFISFLTRPMAHVWYRAIIPFRSIGGRLPRFPLCRLRLRLQATEQGRAHAQAPRREKKKKHCEYWRTGLKRPISIPVSNNILRVFTCILYPIVCVILAVKWLSGPLTSPTFSPRLHSCCAYILAVLLAAHTSSPRLHSCCKHWNFVGEQLDRQPPPASGYRFISFFI